MQSQRLDRTRLRSHRLRNLGEGLVHRAAAHEAVRRRRGLRALHRRLLLVMVALLLLVRVLLLLLLPLPVRVLRAALALLLLMRVWLLLSVATTISTRCRPRSTTRGLSRTPASLVR